METRTLESPPSILPLYARAAAPMIPGASRLPFLSRRRRRDPRDRARAGRRAGRPRGGRRLRPGLRLPPPRPPSPHLPARARLPPAHGGDGGRRLPVRRGRPRHLENEDRAETADRRRRGDLPYGAADSASTAPERADLRPRDRGARRRGAGLGERQHDAAPRQGRRRRQGQREEVLRRPHTGLGRRAPGRRAGAIGRVEARRRPGAPLRRRLRRSQPDPHALADREAPRLPRGDRARDVDQGPLPGGARAPPARCLHRRSRLPPPDPASGQGRVRQPHRRRADELLRPRRRRREAHTTPRRERHADPSNPTGDSPTAAWASG